MEEENCAVIATEVSAIQLEAETDLKAAEPIIAAAEEALNSLDKGSLTELKAFGSPAEAVVKVASATIILTAGKPKVPKDISWAAAKKMMGNVGQFLDSLVAFDKVRQAPGWPRSWAKFQPFLAACPQECTGQLACCGPT